MRVGSRWLTCRRGAAGLSRPRQKAASPLLCVFSSLERKKKTPLLSAQRSRTNPRGRRSSSSSSFCHLLLLFFSFSTHPVVWMSLGELIVGPAEQEKAKGSESPVTASADFVLSSQPINVLKHLEVLLADCKKKKAPFMSCWSLEIM